MRLWKINQAPSGGWKYYWQDNNGNRFTSIGISAKSLERNVRKDMIANNVLPPDNLWQYIEDQICTRQPPGACYYEQKTGDQISKFIHVFASQADKAALAIGLKLNLEKKARGCTGCSQRRVSLNK